MDASSQDAFLARLRADGWLQGVIHDPVVSRAVEMTARAAGYTLRAADLVGADSLASDPSPPGDEDSHPTIDFDGDGAADAVWTGTRWVMANQDDG
jgi:hypothetical protein